MPVAATAIIFGLDVMLKVKKSKEYSISGKQFTKHLHLVKHIQTHQKLHHTFQKCVRLHVRKDHFKTYMCKKGVVICSPRN